MRELYTAHQKHRRCSLPSRRRAEQLLCLLPPGGDLHGWKNNGNLIVVICVLKIFSVYD